MPTNYLWGNLLITLIEIQKMYWPGPEQESTLRTGGFTYWIMWWYSGRNSLHLVIRISISPTHIISNIIKNRQLQKELCSLLGVSSLTSAAVINIIIKNNLVGKDLFCLIPPGTQTFTEGAQSKNSRQELEADTIDECADLLASLGLCRYLSYTLRPSCLGMMPQKSRSSYIN